VQVSLASALQALLQLCAYSCTGMIRCATATHSTGLIVGARCLPHTLLTPFEFSRTCTCSGQLRSCMCVQRRTDCTPFPIHQSCTAYCLAQLRWNNDKPPAGSELLQRPEGVVKPGKAPASRETGFSARRLFPVRLHRGRR
jgi:hypothetical protein